jgi:acetylglutamate kinase
VTETVGRGIHPSRILVKIGGAQLEEASKRRELAEAIADARRDGLEVVLVHGGGAQIRALSRRVGLQDRYHDGLRITDADTADLALMTLGGSVGRALASALEEAGVRAVSLTGADGGTFSAAPHRPDGHDLGYVGVPHVVRPDLMEALLGWGAVPVIATVAPLDPSCDGDRSRFYNINADHAVAPLARALGCGTVLFLTDVEGVRGTDGARIPVLTPRAAGELRTEGVLTGGMIPKVSAALDALAGYPDAVVKIAPAGPDAVRQALQDDVGTRFVRTGDGAPERPQATSMKEAYPEHPLDAHMVRNYARAAEVFVAGAGAELRTAEGDVYLDFLSGIGVSALGHGHPALSAALADQAQRTLHVSNLFRHPFTEEVAERLARLTGLDAVLFANSGAEANEAALKLARKHQRDAGRPERTGFIALQGGFHGRTMGALSVTSGAAYRTPFEPLVPGTTFVEPHDLDALSGALYENPPAAVILEPIQGEGGIVELEVGYLRGVRDLCTRTGTILIHDEIQSGCGRTGTFLAAQAAGVRPDVVTLAKPLAAGLPLGAVVVTSELSGVLRPGNHGSTFAGGPLTLRAALVFLQALEEDGLLQDVRARGARMRAGLDRIAGTWPVVTEVRGRGLMLGLRLAEGAPALKDILYDEHRLIANCTAKDVVRFLPPFVVTDPQIDDALERIEASLHALQARLGEATPPRLQEARS